MLVPGLILMGAGLLLILYTQFSREPHLPAGARRSRGIVLKVQQQQISGQFISGVETIRFSVSTKAADSFFPGQQIFVDYMPSKPAQPLQVLSIKDVLGSKFSKIVIAVLLIIAGALLLRLV